MGCACSAPADDFDDALKPEAFTGPSRTMLARPKPRVLAVIAAWHAADETESASAIPRTRSKTRPGPLAEVAGKPMVFHAWHAAHAAKCVTQCVVATDDDAVEAAALKFGARVVRVDDTSTTKNINRFASVAFAARALSITRRAFDAVAVVDADEAFVEAHHIELVADAVIDSDAQSATCVRARDAADKRNDRGRVFVEVAEQTETPQAPSTTRGATRPAKYVARVFPFGMDESLASLSSRVAYASTRGEYAAEDEGDGRESNESHSPKSPLAREEAKSVSFSSSSKTKAFVAKSLDKSSVGVEVGVRSYVASKLLEVLQISERTPSESRPRSRTDHSAPPKKTSCSFARTLNSDEGRKVLDGPDDVSRLGPTSEALLLGWRVVAVLSSERNLGGLKTQRSLDAKNARIRAGEIRL